MLGFLNRLLDDQEGATVVEYGMLVGMIALSMLLGMSALTNSLSNLYVIVESNTTRAKNAHLGN
jgi:pilus assembly protein Flp/PilA